MASNRSFPRQRDSRAECSAPAICAPGSPLARRRAVDRAAPPRPALLRQRAVFAEIGAQLLHRRLGIDARLLDAVGPGLGQRLRRFFPIGELGGRQLVDVVALLRLDLGDAAVFEVGPGAGDLERPVGGAVVVDHLLCFADISSYFALLNTSAKVVT